MTATAALLIQHGLHKWQLVIAMQDDNPPRRGSYRNLKAFYNLSNLGLIPSHSIIMLTPSDIEPIRNVCNCKSVLSSGQELMQKFTVRGVCLVQNVRKEGMLKLEAVRVGFIHWCHINPSTLHSQPLLCMDNVGIELLRVSAQFSLLFPVVVGITTTL